ncbi:MAG: hypothetical protein ACLFTK_09060 [Anaerolineales bacterium]
MIFQSIITQLHAAEPQERLTALRVLAMLEETRALDAVYVLYTQDDDAAVRQTAQWAGQILYAAQQRGYSTAEAIQTHFAGSGKAVQEQWLETMRQQSESVSGIDNWHVDRSSGQHEVPRHASSSPPSVADLDLLDAGLSDTFWDADG